MLIPLFLLKISLSYVRIGSQPVYRQAVYIEASWSNTSFDSICAAVADWHTQAGLAGCRSSSSWRAIVIDDTAKNSYD